MLVDRKGIFLAANNRLADWLGYTSDEVVGLKFVDMPFFTAKSKATVVKMFQRRMSGRPVAPYDLEFVAKNGVTHIGRLVGSVVTDEQGRPEADLAMISDVTEQREAENALRASREKIEGLRGTARRLEACGSEDEVCRVTAYAARTVLGFPRCVVARVDDGRLVWQPELSDVSPACDLSTAEIPGGPIVDAHRDHKSIVFHGSNEAGCAGITCGITSGICAPIAEEGVLCVGSDDSRRYNDKDARLLELLLGHTVEALGRIRLLGRLREQATRDLMTGLHNRRYFSETIDREIARSRRYGYGIGFLMIDVNGFKAINDTYGHQTGDDVLCAVASFLEGHVRSSEMVVRFGGDEFLIVMPECTGEIDLVRKRLVESFRGWAESCDRFNFHLEVAIGSAVWSPHGSASIEETIAEADQRMYRNKRRQRRGRRRRETRQTDVSDAATS